MKIKVVLRSSVSIGLQVKAETIEQFITIVNNHNDEGYVIDTQGKAVKVGEIAAILPQEPDFEMFP